MKKIQTTGAAVLVLLTATLFSASGFGASEKKCALERMSEVNLLNEDGVLIPVKIQGKSALMVLHMSTGLSYFFEPAVTEFALARHSLATTRVSAGGITVTEFAAFSSLTLGNINFGKSEFLVYPNKAGLRRYDDLPVVGALGMDVFANVDFELDLAHKKLSVYSQNHCAGQVVYWTGAYSTAKLYKGAIGNLYFAMELDGKKLQATIDTSNQASSLHTDVTKTLYGFDEHSPGTERESSGSGAQDSYYYRAMKMTAPGLAVTNAKIRLRGPEKDCHIVTASYSHQGTGYSVCMGVFPLELGRGILEKLRFYFATKEMIVYFSAADATL